MTTTPGEMAASERARGLYDAMWLQPNGPRWLALIETAITEAIDTTRTEDRATIGQLEREAAEASEERRLLRIELAHARHETCVCYHPHGECLTCGCIIFAAEQYQSQQSRDRATIAARDATIAGLRALEVAVRGMVVSNTHRWCSPDDCAYRRVLDALDVLLASREKGE